MISKSRLTPAPNDNSDCLVSRLSVYFIAALTYWPILFPAQTQAAIPVFRTPQSRYDSGSADHSLLKKNIKKISPKQWAQVTSNKKKYWIETGPLIHPLQFALTATAKKTSFAYSQANLSQKIKTPLIQGERVFIHEIKPHWAQVSRLERPPKKTTDKTTGKTNDKNNDDPNAPTKDRFWVEQKDLLAKDIFNGYVFAKDRTILYKKAHEKSRILVLLDTDTQLRVKSIKDRWIHIAFGKLSGYVLIEQVLGPWAIAHSIKSDGQWHLVSGQSQDQVITSKKQKVPVAKIENLRFSQKKRLVGGMGLKLRHKPDSKSPSVAELAAGDLVFLDQKKSELWAESHISYIGDVWWKMTASNDKLQKDTDKLISNKVLFSKQIFDMASSPKVPGLLFASAGGLFRSIDGHRWRPIDRFKGKNLALAVAKNGTVFAGSYFSKDNGKTFESFIRWDQFIHHLQQSIPTLPVRGLKSVKITKLIPTGPSDHHLNLDLLIAGKKIKAETTNRGQSWKFLR